MLIQTTSPRPMINTADSPENIRIHTLRKPGISTGEVALVLGERRMEIEPCSIYTIGWEEGFEALDFFIPFDNVFGTKKPVYDENTIRQNIEHTDFSSPRGKSDKLAKVGDQHPDRLTGIQLALLGASGYAVIARSAYRTEGATYEERVLNFTIHCPVNGGGMIRIANVPFDISNPTFNPHAETPKKTKHKDLTLLEAFNRTHRPRTDAIEERKRKRIEEAEANLRANDGKLLDPKLTRS